MSSVRSAVMGPGLPQAKAGIVAIRAIHGHHDHHSHRSHRSLIARPFSREALKHAVGRV